MKIDSNLKKILLLIALFVFVSPVLLALAGGNLTKVGEDILTGFLTLFFGVIFFGPFVLLWRVVKYQLFTKNKKRN